MDWDDLYIEVHEELIREYLDENPGATEEEASRATEDQLADAVIDRWSGMVDWAHDISKGH